MKEVDKKQQELQAKVLEVRNLLHSHGIDTSTWGQGTKTVEHLANEILDGETELVVTDEGLIRKVSFVKVDVRYMEGDTELQLVEDRQEFNDGDVRRRSLIGVSEKMKPGEEIVRAAKRGMKEELGISMDGEFSEPVLKTKTRTSPSYPGLMSQYESYVTKTFISDEQFNTDGYVEVQEDKKTIFEWVESGYLKDPK